MVPAQTGSRAIPWPGARSSRVARRSEVDPFPGELSPSGRWLCSLVLVGLITIVEATAGRPLSDILRNQPGNGTSFLGGDSGGGGSSTPTHAPSASVTTHRVRSCPRLGDGDTEHAEQRAEFQLTGRERLYESLVKLRRKQPGTPTP